MFHEKHEAWARQAEDLGLSLSTHQLSQLALYEALLQRIAIPRGMVARSDADRLWERHVLDALRGARHIPKDASVADMGSGAGIPGIPLAVALPGSTVALVEPRTARAAFLEAVVDELRTSNAKVVPRRIEEAAGPFRACVARAFASPLASWQAAQCLLEPGGVLVYWAGETFDPAPLEAARVPFRLSAPSHLARTGPLVIMGPQ